MHFTDRRQAPFVRQYHQPEKRADGMPEFPRIVVTGVGLVTPLGHDVPSTWDAMLAGKSGTARVSAFDAEAYEVQVAGEVKGFVPEALMDHRTARRSGRHTQFAVVAAREAVEMAGLAVDDTNRDSIGVMIASSGTMHTITDQEKIIEE